MRIGASLIVDNGNCYQSHQWLYHRSIGRIELALAALDERKVDEIFVINMPKTAGFEESAFENAAVLSRSQISTPLVFGGGFAKRNIEEIMSLAPCDRYCISSELINRQYDTAERILEHMGRQALLCCLPFRRGPDGYGFYSTRSRTFKEIDQSHIEKLYKICDEVIFYDVKADGGASGFDFSILEICDKFLNRTILCGGIGKEELKKARSSGAAACYIENRLLHDER